MYKIRKSFLAAVYICLAIGAIFSQYMNQLFIFYVHPLFSEAALLLFPGLVILSIFQPRIDDGYHIFTALVLGLLGIELVTIVITVFNSISQTLIKLSPISIIFTESLIFFPLLYIYGRDITIQPLSVNKGDILSILLIPLSIASVQLLNETGITVGIYVLLVGLLAVPFLSLWGGLRHSSISVFSLSLATLYHYSLWKHSFPIEMWASAVTFGLQNWHPVLMGGIGQESILPTAVAYPTLAIGSSIGILKQLMVINPIIVSLIPVGMYILYREYIGKKGAYVLTLIFIFTFRFYAQNYPSGARDTASTLFFVALLVILAKRRDNQQRMNKLCLIAFIFGIATSHYGTAYLLTIIFIGSHIGSQLLSYLPLENDSSDKFRIPLSIYLLPVSAIAWFMFTAGGVKFQLLANVVMLAQKFRIGGSSTAVLTREVGTLKLLIKYIYLIIWFLIGLGVITNLMRIVKKDLYSLSREYTVLSVGGLFVVFLTFLPVSLGFSTSRIMMILFPLLLIHIWSFFTSATPLSEMQTIHTITVIVAVLLILNTGFVTGISGYGNAPNQVLTNDQLSESTDIQDQWNAKYCPYCEASTLTWIYSYNALPYHTDRWAKGWVWYGAAILNQDTQRLLTHSVRQNSGPSKVIRGQSIEDIPRDAYIYLTSKNVHTGMYMTNDKELAKYSIGKGDKIYSTGHTAIIGPTNHHDSIYLGSSNRS
ncbi:MAG: DUF2206 domain-containing protein [Halobacteriaceae archaeon]